MRKEKLKTYVGKGTKQGKCTVIKFCTAVAYGGLKNKATIILQFKL